MTSIRATTRHPIRLLATTLTLLLTSCIPTTEPQHTQPRHDLAIVGAPSSSMVPGAAAGLTQALIDRGYAGTILPNHVTRFLEQRAGMVGVHIPPAAARLARSMGVATIVVIEPADLQRELRETPSGRMLWVALTLRVRIIDPDTETIRAERLDVRRTASAYVDDEALPALTDDPVLASLQRSAVAALAPWLHGMLEPSTVSF